MSDSGTLFADGHVYERLMGRWSRLVGDQFLRWLDRPPGQRWLDVGCGNGAFTEGVLAHAAPASVIGVDPSAGQISYAQSRPGTQRADFRLGDAQALPFAESEFDTVAMALVIAFVPDPSLAVSEMARVARPGGSVATYMWDFPGGRSPVSPIFRALQSLGIDPPRPQSAAVATLAELSRLWRGAGLQDVETREIPITVTYADVDEFWEVNAVPSGPQGILIHHMPPAEKARVRDRLGDYLPADQDGRIAYEAVANAIKGVAPDPG